MEPIPEEMARHLLQQNYNLLESYSNELEKTDLQEERIDEILTQVKNIAECSKQGLDTLMTTSTCPVESESLESSLYYLQNALAAAELPGPSRQSVLKRVLYYSRLALLSPWGWWQLTLSAWW